VTTHPEQSLRVLQLNEPMLEFALKQTTAHPKDGLFLYGPRAKPRKSHDVRLGVIGTPAGLGHFREWTKRMRELVKVPPPGKGAKLDRLHLVNFPGLEEAFGITLNDDFAAYPLDLKAIDQATRIVNLHEAVSKVVKIYADKARKHRDNDERPIDLWILIVPEIIFERCKPNARRIGLPLELGDFRNAKRSARTCRCSATCLRQRRCSTTYPTSTGK
jgi:hypothetical protein